MAAVVHRYSPRVDGGTSSLPTDTKATAKALPRTRAASTRLARKSTELVVCTPRRCPPRVNAT
jgi:hypothetical protein